MTEQESLELAAQAWCAPRTQHKDMDPELATEFARILRREVDIISVDHVITALNVLQNRMEADQSYAQSWRDNLAYAIRGVGADRELADQAASRILQMFFGVTPNEPTVGGVEEPEPKSEETWRDRDSLL